MRYSTLEEFGITDPGILTWYPMPDGQAAEVHTDTAQDEDIPHDDNQDGPGPLTIPEAKAGLALGLGVPESAIEIIVRY